MNVSKDIGGSFTFRGTTLNVNRMGYGAMQLAGSHVMGPPRDREEAVAVLREAVESGVNHIDTADFYGPHVTNQIIREARHPYRDDLVIVTKVGVRRGSNGLWNPAISRKDLKAAVEENLRNLGLDRLHIVNLRVPILPANGSIEQPFAALAELKEQGLIEFLGISAATPAQLSEAQKIANVVCVQNLYNVAHREDDDFLDQLAEQRIAYVPFFPLGGFNPLQSSALDEIAASVNATPRQVALAWLLRRAPNVLLIPGTSSREHLRENLRAATLQLPPEAQTRLDALVSTIEWLPPYR
jgi:aryl-alcohol dehydrogenase-like predicted oxidoreductase